MSFRSVSELFIVKVMNSASVRSKSFEEKTKLHVYDNNYTVTVANATCTKSEVQALYKIDVQCDLKFISSSKLLNVDDPRYKNRVHIPSESLICNNNSNILKCYKC